MAIVSECGGNIAEAARRLGRDYSTVEEHYQAGFKKIGTAEINHRTQSMKCDLRGQVAIAKGDDRRG